jgi:hypothetical protein
VNLLVQALNVYVPARLKRRKLLDLFEATAAACGTAMPALDGFSAEECLERYAVFTRDEIGRKIQAGEDMQELKETLYRHAYRLGNELRRQLRLRRKEDVLSVGRALYRAIGIDFEGNMSGSVRISSCYFSRYYDAGVCRIMSSLDEGIAAGLSGGRKLTFSQRITEGKPTCEAAFDFNGGAA